eukprot:s4710_g2.t1
MTSRFLVSILHENLLQQQVAPLLASPALPSSPLRQCSFATEFFLVHCCCTTSGDGAPKDFVVHKCYWKERRQLPASRPQRVCGAAPRRLFSSSWTDTFVGCEVEAVLNASLQFCSANWPRSHRVCWQKTGPTADRKERVLVFLPAAALVKNSLEHRIASSDAARELELRVLSEQELRLKEGASWNQCLAALQRERDHLQAQLSNDTAQLGAQLEDASRRRAEETSQLEAQICQLQTSLVSSESRLSEERSQNGETIANLKGQLAESAATLSAVRLQMQEVGHARDLLAAEVAETRLSLQSEQHRAEAQRSEATALLQQVETRNTALQDQASREREVLEADRQRLQEMLVKEAQQAKELRSSNTSAQLESQEQYDRWRESHVESLRRVQDETSAKMLALEREKDGVQSELREAIRSLNTKQAQLEATDKDAVLFLQQIYLLIEPLSSQDLQRLRSEAQEAAAVMEAKQQLSKELNEVTEALEGALRTEATLTGKIEDAAQRHQQEKRDLELQVLDKDSRLQKFKLDFETQLRISQSRLAGELNKEKAKADLAAASLPWSCALLFPWTRGTKTMGSGASKKAWGRRFHITSNVPDPTGETYQQIFPVWTIAVTKNQRQLATATSDNRINLWCLVTHQLLAPLIGHADTIWRLAYSPDDLLLASTSADGTVRLWEANLT